MWNETQYGYNGTMPLQYDIVGTKDTRKLQNNTTVAPFRYICQILTKQSDGKTYVGTGFFVGPRTILTAGHVVWDKHANRKIPNNKFRIAPARNGNSKPFRVFKPVNVVTSYPGYSKADFATHKDYAIIHLRTNVGNITGFFGRGKWAQDSYGSTLLPTPQLPLPPDKLKINLCGYPADKGGEKQYSSFNMGFKMQDSGRIITYLNDTFGGHSGSPVWIKRDPSLGGRVIIGIHIAAGPSSHAGSGVDYNRAVFLSPTVKSFVKKHLK